MEKLLIIDGNSILNRAYYGIRMLNAPDGTPTNAVYGFLNILFKHLEGEKPDYLCVAFDVKEKTFRHKMYDLYKAQRKPAPEDFLVQLPLIKEVLQSLNCACIEKPGYEADDLIGTVSRLCEERGIECQILTGDKDDLQLASENTVIKLVITRMGKTDTTDYRASEVMEKYGVTPSEFIDVKGLMGDPSDNIPGVKGIGEKTAFSLIKEYKSIAAIYERLDEIDVTKSVRKKLAADKEGALLSRTLAEIDRNVPMEFDFEGFRCKPYDAEKASQLFTRLNFKSFLKKLDLPAEVKTEAEPIHGKLKKIKADELSGLLTDKICYMLDKTAERLYVTENGKDIYSAEISDNLIKEVFENESIKKCGYNIKEDIIYLAEKGIEFKNTGFDVMLAAYLADPSGSDYSPEGLCFKYLGKELSSTDIKAEDDGQIVMNLDSEDKSDEGQSFADKTAAIYELYSFFAKKLKDDGQEELYYGIELPLTEVLADMQLTGVYVDKEALQSFGDKLSMRIENLTSEIYDAAGESFNINSPKQLSVILFEKLGLPGGKKTKSGYSTGAEVLNKLADKHPIVQMILEFRQLSKLKSTYVDGLLPMINPKTGRIHSSFNQTVTATGRISSTEPNLQNIPVRTELGREIRRMFTAESDNDCLVDADYSQIELRVLAHMSDDENMKAAFTKNIDIHTQTASQVFSVPIDMVDSVMRFRAKAVNFGIVYGIGAFSLAQDLKIPVKEADAYIKQYLHHYPNVDEYMKKAIDDARKTGYAVTMMGRRRNIPELKASNKNVQAFGERVAMNAPIQGSAADIIKAAMVKVYKRLKRENLKSKLILQVHDELIIEAPNNEKDAVRKLLKEEMEGAAKLNVPLVVDMNDGKSWYDTK